LKLELRAAADTPGRVVSFSPRRVLLATDSGVCVIMKKTGNGSTDASGCASVKLRIAGEKTEIGGE